MSTGNRRFRIGEFECAIVSDGTFSYPQPGRMFFANAPAGELADALAEFGIELSNWDSFDSPYPCLFVNTGHHKLLVDTGAGKFGPKTGQLVENLGALGVRPDEIDVVILTHAHPDHIGGVIDDRGKPTFPKSRYVMTRTEREFWHGGPDLSSLSVSDGLKAALLECPARMLPPLSGQLDLIEPEAEIVDGVRAVDAAGHTPGQIAVRIESGGQQLLAVADAIVHPIHLSHPDWYTAVDLDPETSVDTRRRLLDLAVASDALIFAYHFTTPGIGHAKKSGDAWQWVPADD